MWFAARRMAPCVIFANTALRNSWKRLAPSRAAPSKYSDKPAQQQIDGLTSQDQARSANRSHIGACLDVQCVDDVLKENGDFDIQYLCKLQYQ